jgi:hypothetical protein
VTKLVALVVIALALGAGGGWLLYERTDDDDEGQAADWNTCVNPVAGFSISYPAGWYTAHSDLESACMSFDPRPLEPLSGGDSGPRALQVTVGGTNPGRFERSSDDGLSQYGHVVEDDGRAFTILTTFNQGVDYAAWKRIVDRAADSLVVSEPRTQATEGADVVQPQLGLPEPVARKRAQIWAAARAGDHDALAALVDPTGFEYTFGGAVPGGAAAYWRQLEQTTDEEPLETLVAILELPHVLQAESKLYVWPDAFTRMASSLTSDEKEQLADAIGADALKLYEQSGNYLGYRAGIDEQGDWVFYVAGD